MTIDPITSLASIRSELETGWKLFDDVFNTFDARQWEKKFGRTWSYADQPWHLAYFDAMIAKHVAAGPIISEANRLFIRSMGEMAAWNTSELARRSASHTVDDSLAEMRKQRDVIRGLLASMTDADLDERAWMPLIFGWSTKRGLLQACIIHNRRGVLEAVDPHGPASRGAESGSRAPPPRLHDALHAGVDESGRRGCDGVHDGLELRRTGRRPVDAHRGQWAMPRLE